MKRRLLIGLFTFGTLFGFGSGFFSMARWHHHHHQRRAAYRVRDRRPRDAPPPRWDDRDDRRRGHWSEGRRHHDRRYDDRGYDDRDWR